MSNVYLTLVAASGGSYAATIERLSDNYYREDDAEVFGSGLAFSDKDVSLSEGDGANRGTYTAVLDASSWSDGIYRLRTHNLSSNNVSVGTSLFGVVAGNEVSVGEAVAIYHADISFMRDQANSQDEYTLTWFKNGVRITSGVTNAALSVVKRSDGTKLINSVSMTQVGTTGSYKYDATGISRQTVGEACIVVPSATIDSATRTFSWVLGRDSS